MLHASQGAARTRFFSRPASVRDVDGTVLTLREVLFASVPRLFAPPVSLVIRLTRSSKPAENATSAAPPAPDTSAKPHVEVVLLVQREALSPSQASGGALAASAVRISRPSAASDAALPAAVEPAGAPGPRSLRRTLSLDEAASETLPIATAADAAGASATDVIAAGTSATEANATCVDADAASSSPLPEVPPADASTPVLSVDADMGAGPERPADDASAPALVQRTGQALARSSQPADHAAAAGRAQQQVQQQQPCAEDPAASIALDAAENRAKVASPSPVDAAKGPAADQRAGAANATAAAAPRVDFENWLQGPLSKSRRGAACVAGERVDDLAVPAKAKGRRKKRKGKALPGPAQPDTPTGALGAPGAQLERTVSAAAASEACGGSESTAAAAPRAIAGSGPVDSRALGCADPGTSEAAADSHPRQPTAGDPSPPGPAREALASSMAPSTSAAADMPASVPPLRTSLSPAEHSARPVRLAKAALQPGVRVHVAGCRAWEAEPGRGALLDAPLEFLWRTLRAPDMFLYVVAHIPPAS